MGSDPTLVLREGDARAVVLARAVEEADLDAQVVPTELRAAGIGSDDPGPGLAARADRIATRVTDAHPGFARVARLGVPRGWPLFAFAFGLGLASNVFGSERRFHVLANPLAALVLWNLVVFLALLVLWLVRRDGRVQAGGTELLARVLASRPLRGLSAHLTASEPQSTAAVLRRAATRFAEDWLRVSRPLQIARLRSQLHTAAILVTVGSLGGLLAKGLVLEYRAHWESTFLQEAQGQALLDTFLAPAATLGGPDVPRISDWAEADAEQRRADTRSILALFVGTVVLFVVVPRAALAFAARSRARRLAAALPLDTSPLYYRRLLSERRGGGLSVAAFPYSFGLTAARSQALAELLRDVFGGRARVDVRPSLPYGAEVEDLEDEDVLTQPLVLLFNLAQTPERELQGRLLEGVRARANGGLVALADCSAWRERVGAGPTFASRLVEHRASWDELAAALGVRIVHVDLEARADAETLTAIEAALAGGTTGAEVAP